MVTEESVIKTEIVVETTCGDVVVKPMSARMFLAVKKDLAVAVSQMIVKVKEKGAENITAELVMDLLDFVPGLLALFDQTIKKESGFCEDLPFVDLTEVINAIIEMNDVQRIVKNLKRARGIFQTKEAAQPVVKEKPKRKPASEKS